MRLLDRYLLKELLFPLGLCLGGFSIFWIAFDLMNELPRLQGAHLTLPEMAEYYLCRMPEYLAFPIVPVALLLALLYTLTSLARHSELVAMRAAGISLWRISLPYLAVGCFCCIAILLLNEVFAPNSAAAAEQILARHLDTDEAARNRQWVNNLNFRNDRAGRIWTIPAYHTGTTEMKNPTVEWTAADKSIHRIVAKTGLRTNGVWTFYEVDLFVWAPPAFDVPRPLRTNVVAVAEFDETPDLLASEIKISSMTLARAAKKLRFTLAEILSYQRLHPQLDEKMYAMLQTQFHGRLAQPWISLVVVLIALPFGAGSGRRNAFAGVASSISICFAYFVLAQIGLNLGTGGHLPPWLAAWLPNLVFGSGALWFIFRSR
jgi:lipopolysaccharide export system permease protein